MTAKELYLEETAKGQYPEVVKCLDCERPLGSDSRDMELPLCPEHRLCVNCKREVLSRAEINYCFKHKLEPTHARCLVLSVATRDNSELADETTELMNLARLVFLPADRITATAEATAQMQRVGVLLNHDEILSILTQLQNITAVCSIIAAKKKREIDLDADPVRRSREERSEKAAQQVEKIRAQPKTKTEKEKVSKESKQLRSFEEMAELMGIPEADRRQWALTRIQELVNSKKDMLK